MRPSLTRSSKIKVKPPTSVPFQSLAFVRLLSPMELSFSTSFLRILGPIGNGAFISRPRPRVINSCISTNPRSCLGIPPAHAKTPPLLSLGRTCSLSFQSKKESFVKPGDLSQIDRPRIPFPSAPARPLLSEFLLQANTECKTTRTPPLPANTQAPACRYNASLHDTQLYNYPRNKQNNLVPAQAKTHEKFCALC